jgi:aryl-alcohol dehydrogenase-like predicted oxidoreductase
MKYTKLGNTGMDVSRIRLGCMGFDGGYESSSSCIGLYPAQVD